MSTAHQDEERKRLTDVYAHKTDTELKDLAEAGSSLTDLAREALHAEIDRRRLSATVRPSRDSVDEPRPPNLVVIRRYLSVDEALLAKSVLDSAGVLCFLGDQNMIRLDWFLSNALGGVKLLVREEDAPAANELLKQNPPDSFVLEGAEIYVQPRCPSCGSFDVVLGAVGTIDYGPFTINARAPTAEGWTCNACGHRWEDDLESRT